VKESEILKSAMGVCNRLKKYGFSRYASTRPIMIISSTIIEAKKAKFGSSREIGREMKKGKPNEREKLKKDIYGDVRELTGKMYEYFRKHGFKKFIVLTRYLSDAAYVEMEFGGG